MTSPNPRPPKNLFNSPNDRPDSIIRRSWHAMSERLHLFSPAALASLPNVTRPSRYTRADNIPDVDENDQDANGQRPTVRDYHAINTLPPQVRVPKKIKTPIKVESKVWFANERTWVAWLNLSVLLATLALALFNASKDNIARDFAYAYAAISIGVMVYGYVLYQHRLTMIQRRDPGHFDALAGPVIVSLLLFFAILANFIIRVRELQQKNIPIPGTDLIAALRSYGYAGTKNVVLSNSTA
ncbi:hypothetical protein GYMLUDRAFT_48048 [Collybiopsis luxurians FD-317 M1]|uniref:DUF202 domain-containing protein n=1 Tax=Collybiopsis luxurians FD-317 M1 TaxID=944289 RepID=A0A0D0BYY7_9AGAR|nr:hypothetical protein GYMLUDRAFT_48048 [Collybiopsis luxurians FD-317 M1]